MLAVCAFLLPFSDSYSYSLPTVFFCIYWFRYHLCSLFVSVPFNSLWDSNKVRYCEIWCDFSLLWDWNIRTLIFCTLLSASVAPYTMGVIAEVFSVCGVVCTELPLYLLLEGHWLAIGLICYSCLSMSYCEICGLLIRCLMRVALISKRFSMIF